MSDDGIVSKNKEAEITFTDWKKMRKLKNATIIKSSPESSQQMPFDFEDYNRKCNEFKFQEAFRDYMLHFGNSYGHALNVNLEKPSNNIALPHSLPQNMNLPTAPEKTNDISMLQKCNLHPNSFNIPFFGNSEHPNNFLYDHTSMMKFDNINAPKQDLEKFGMVPGTIENKSEIKKSFALEERRLISNTPTHLYGIPPKSPKMTLSTIESKEEKQRLWREYRQKMKPFRNRVFLNAKRVVQRLGKKDFEELEEKEKERLTRAKIQVDAHKAYLSKNATNPKLRKILLRQNRIMEKELLTKIQVAAHKASPSKKAIDPDFRNIDLLKNAKEKNPSPGLERSLSDFHTK